MKTGTHTQVPVPMTTPMTTKHDTGLSPSDYRKN